MNFTSNKNWKKKHKQKGLNKTITLFIPLYFKKLCFSIDTASYFLHSPLLVNCEKLPPHFSNELCCLFYNAHHQSISLRILQHQNSPTHPDRSILCALLHLSSSVLDDFCAYLVYTSALTWTFRPIFQKFDCATMFSQVCCGTIWWETYQILLNILLEFSPFGFPSLF